MSNNGFRSWSSFADSDEAGLEIIWKRAVVQLAILQHGESTRTTEVPAPEYDDAVTVFDEAVTKKLLPWWPEKLERVVTKIRATPLGQTTETLSPIPIDPNTKDLGKTMFVNAIVNQLEGQGDFDGNIQIQILRATDKSIIGGFRQEVLVGTKAKKKRGGSGGDDRDDRIEELLERDKRQLDMVERMFNNSAHTLGAAASVVQATRGVNPAPPWMQDGAEGSPLWFNLLNAGMQIGGALLTGQDPKKQIQKIMSEPGHPMLDGGGPPGKQQGGPPQLPDHGAQESTADTYGSNQFLEEGQYDGFHVIDSDLLDDEFDDDEEDDEDEYEDGDEDDEDDDEDEDEDEDRPKKKKKKTSGNPLDGMDPDKVGKVVEEWVDRNIGQHKGKIQGFGVRLAGKIMKG